MKNDTNLKLLFSSVVPLALRQIRNNFKGSKYKVIEIKNLKIKKMIKINVKKIKQLGSDRIVNAIEGKKYKNCHGKN